MTPRVCLVPLAFAILSTGCGGNSIKTSPVSGRVTVDGQPLSNALVTFLPVGGGAGQSRPSSIGTTDENGRYTLVLNNGDKTAGAVEGKHKVSITLGAQGGSADTKPTFHRQLPERFNRKSELECVVPANGRDDANFELKSK
jgi:hypothetical protein